jgi:hypothetical protein
MGILAPLGLALALLAIPIIIFYMLRLRRHEITVSSNMLWQQVLQDRQANAPWQKLRRNLLLLLQLLLLALLVLALARPFVFTDAPAAGNLIVVLDGSASMQATDGPGPAVPTRFAAAQREAARLAGTLAPGDRMTVIWAGPSPVLAVTGSSSAPAIQAAIAALRPGNGVGDMVAALTLAAGAAAQLAPASVIVISDGALGPQALPALPAPVQFIPVGQSGRNQAITGLVVRDAPGGPQLFVSLANYDAQAAPSLLSVRVSHGPGDERLWDSRQLDLAAGGDQTLTFTGLPLDTALVTATLGAPDLLPLDNTAWAVRATAATTNTLLVSTGNTFLEKALRLLPGVRLFKVAPAEYTPSAGFALTVFDSYLPATLPPGNLLLVNPPDSPLVPISGTLEYPTVGLIEQNDPLLRYVDWSQVHIGRAAQVLPPPWARTLVRTTGGAPHLLVGETDGHRIAVLPFDLHQTDLPLLITFPIQMTNLMGWLQPTGTIETPPRLSPGTALALHPRADAEQVIITSPSGRITTLPAAATVPFADTAELGVYTVQQRVRPVVAATPVVTGTAVPAAPAAGALTAPPPEYFAVNLFSPVESAIAPHDQLAVAGQAPAVPATSAQRPQEFWPWLLVVGLALLTLEWWIYNRGRTPWATLPRRWGAALAALRPRR